MGAYKIKDIERLTGIKAHTLRIWEKRYGILTPDRTDTQIRTYTDEDLSYLLNLSILNKNGVKISHLALLKPAEIHQKVNELLLLDSNHLSIETMIKSLIEMDETLFLNTIDFLVSQNGFEKTFIHFLNAFLDRIGVMWMTGAIHPAQEHFISNLIRQKIITLIDQLKVPDEKSQQIILYLPENELHEIGLLFINYILRKGNYSTVYLGQNVPISGLKKSIAAIKPVAILSSWTSPIEEAAFIAYQHSLMSDFPDLKIYCGGRQMNEFPEIEGVRKIKDLNEVIEIFELKLA